MAGVGTAPRTSSLGKNIATELARQQTIVPITVEEITILEGVDILYCCLLGWLAGSQVFDSVSWLEK